MSLLNVKILGYEIDDLLLIKIITGVVSVVLLILILGFNEFGNWAEGSIIVYTATLLFIVALTSYFIEEEIKLKQLGMIIAGIMILAVYWFTAKASVGDLTINVIKSIVSATIFSLIFDAFRKRIDK